MCLVNLFLHLHGFELVHSFGSGMNYNEKWCYLQYMNAFSPGTHYTQSGSSDFPSYF